MPSLESSTFAHAALPQEEQRRGFLQRLRFLPAGLVLLAYWSVCAAVFLPLCKYSLYLRAQPRRRELGQDGLKLFFQGVIGILRAFGLLTIEFRGFEDLEKQRGALILAPNHPALWDAAIVLSYVERTACVVKKSIMRNPYLVAGSSMAGHISNDPSHQMLRRCIELLKGQERVLFFPEGTRTREENWPLNPLSGGLAIIARKSGAPVRPIYIQTTSRYLSKSWPIWRLPAEKIKVTLTLGPVLHCPKDGDIQPFLTELKQLYLEANCGWQDHLANCQSQPTLQKSTSEP